MSSQAALQMAAIFDKHSAYLTNPELSVPYFSLFFDKFARFISECKSTGVKPATTDGNGAQGNDDDTIYLRHIIEKLEGTIYDPDSQDPALSACRTLDDLKSVFATRRVEWLEETTCIKIDKDALRACLTQPPGVLSLPTEELYELMGGEFRDRKRDRWIIAPGANVHIINNMQWFDQLGYIPDAPRRENIVTSEIFCSVAGTTEHKKVTFQQFIAGYPPTRDRAPIPLLSESLPPADIKGISGAGYASLWLTHPDGNAEADDTKRYTKVTLYEAAAMNSAPFNLFACSMPEHIIYKTYDIVIDDHEENEDDGDCFRMVRKGCTKHGRVVGEAVYNEEDGLFEVQHVSMPEQEKCGGGLGFAKDDDFEEYLKGKDIMVGEKVEVGCLLAAEQMKGKPMLPTID